MHTHTRTAHSCSSLVKAAGCRFILQGSGEEQALPLRGPHPASGPSDSLQLRSLNTSSPLSSFCCCWVIDITGAVVNVFPFTADDETTCQASPRRSLPSLSHLNGVCYSIAPRVFQSSSHAWGHRSCSTSWNI